MADNPAPLRRVPALIRAWLRPLPSPDAPTLYLGPAAETREIDKKALRQTNLSETTVDFLIDLHDKLDMVLNLLAQDRLSSQYPIRADVVEIGGSSIVAAPTQPAVIGHAYEILLMLQQFPVQLVSAVARAVEFVDSELGPAVLLHFIRIHEEDQENIVQFVFQQERRSIRQLRWE